MSLTRLLNGPLVRVWGLWAFLCTFSAATFAVEVIGEGMASLDSTGEVVIVDDARGRSARAEAVRRALADAASKAGVELRSTQEVSQGQLITDLIRLRSKGSVRTYRVLEERSEGGYYYVKVAADITEGKREASFNPIGWSLKEFPAGENRVRIHLTKPLVRMLTNGGDGEYIEVVRSYARSIVDEMGFTGFVIERYSESLRSGLLLQERVVEADIGFQR